MTRKDNFNFGWIYFNPNLDGGIFTSCWFFFDNSETVKAVTLTFCSIQYLFIRDIHGKFSISNLSQSPDVRQNSEEYIFNFRISGQSFINENFLNSRASNDTDIKLRPVTKLDKRTTTTLKNLTMTSSSKLWCHCHFSNL